MAVVWPKIVKTHNLPRLIWAAKSSRGVNFFHPSHFARYTSFTSSQLNKIGRWVARNSQNTQFATINLGRKKFARRELFSSQPFCTLHVFLTSQLNKIGRWVARNSQNTQFATINLGRKKFAWRELFSSQPFCTLHVFLTSQLNKNGRCVAKNSQNTQFATFNLARKKVPRRELFSSQPFCTLHVFYVVPTKQKRPLSGPKTVNTHNLSRLIWAAKSSRGANFSHPGHFARYTSFTTSQLNKNGRWKAKNSQNTHFATFNFGRKKFSRRELFSSQRFCTLRVFYDVSTKQKWPLSGQKQSKHTFCHV